MVDPLRTNLKKLVASTDVTPLSQEAIALLLDNHIDLAIEKQHEFSDVAWSKLGKVFDEPPYKTTGGQLVYEVPATDTTTYIASDGITYTEEAAKQFVKAYNLNYDEQTLKDIEDLKKRTKRKTKLVKKYEADTKILLELQKTYNIP